MAQNNDETPENDKSLRWVSVAEAVGELGKSERTVRRWIETGILPHKREYSKLLVGLEDETEQAEQAETPETPDSEVLLARLDAQQVLIEQLTGERDYLRQLIAALTQQKLIAPETPPRRSFFQRFFGGD